MSALLTSPRPASLFDPVVGEADPVANATLATQLDALWSALRGGEVATCPVCTARMEPVFGAGARAVAGRCGGCGTQLS